MWQTDRGGIWYFSCWMIDNLSSDVNAIDNDNVSMTSRQQRRARY